MSGVMLSLFSPARNFGANPPRALSAFLHPENIGDPGLDCVKHAILFFLSPIVSETSPKLS